MSEVTTKEELLERIHRERARFEETIVRLTKDQMIESSLESGWSIKDILAHIVVWESRMIEWLDQIRKDEMPESLDPGNTWENLDQLNQRSYQQNRDKSLSPILAQFQQSFPDAVQAVEDTPDELLFDPDYFEWRQGRPLWMVVAENTFWHYREHREQITTRLDDSETK